MVNRFDRLWHYAVIGSYDQDSNIGDTSSPSPHASEGRVSWCIQERNRFAVDIDLVRPDMLGNPAGFATCYPAMTQGIKQRRFPVVDVSHDSNNWWPWHQVFFVDFFWFKEFVDISNIHLDFFLGFNPVVRSQ